MEMFRRIFVVAVFAGLIAGLALSALQQWRVVPLILQAEKYEVGFHDTSHADETQPVASDHVKVNDSQPWAPADGVERTLYTVLATTLVGIGYTLVLVAVSALVGIDITVSNGVMWGLGGFLTFALAPAFGLPPELPGIVAADLDARQMWWWGTALSTGVGLLAMAKFRTVIGVLGGIALIAIPHLLGAPASPGVASDIPAHLSSAFTVSTLATAMVFWMLSGTGIGVFNQRFANGAGL